jgi:hypothetical protein
MARLLPGPLPHDARPRDAVCRPRLAPGRPARRHRLERLLPRHEDRQKRSLSVTERDGRILLKCFAGCPVDRIAHALGLEVSALFAAENGGPGRPPRRLVARDEYRDEGRVVPVDGARPCRWALASP